MISDAVENLSISALENPMTLEYSFPLISLATPAPTLDARKPIHTEVTAIRSAMATILRPAAHRYLVWIESMSIPALASMLFA